MICFPFFLRYLGVFFILRFNDKTIFKNVLLFQSGILKDNDEKRYSVWNRTEDLNNIQPFIITNNTLFNFFTIFSYVISTRVCTYYENGVYCLCIKEQNVCCNFNEICNKLWRPQKKTKTNNNQPNKQTKNTVVLCHKRCDTVKTIGHKPVINCRNPTWYNYA